VSSWFGAWVVVKEGRVGLLYRDGVCLRTLLPGRHKIGARETLVPVGTTLQSVTISGQEAMSADGFLPKLTAVAEFTVTDAHEQAALRALANADRMLRNTPGLQNLHLLQATGGAGAPVTIVLGTPAGIVPLREGPTEPG
jgi:hypothetical protein